MPFCSCPHAGEPRLIKWIHTAAHVTSRTWIIFTLQEWQLAVAHQIFKEKEVIFIQESQHLQNGTHSN